MAPLCDHDQHDCCGTTRPRRATNAGAETSADPLKPVKVVRFPDAEDLLAATQPQVSTYYPTPPIAREVVHNGSLRRFTIDEVELYFSEDIPRFPVSPTDYAVMKVAGRDEYLVCGCVEVRKTKMGLTIWKKCWAELYHGILMLRKYKDKIEKKRILIPIARCKVEFADFKEFQLEIEYAFQGHATKCVLRFITKCDMFLWWWSLQIASMSSVDSKLLHKSMSRPSLAPYEVVETANQIENVLFPKVMRTPKPRPPVIEAARKQGVTHVILIRHGEAANIHFRVCDRDKRLTDRGQEQADYVASFLDSEFQQNQASEANVSLIYGGLRRSVETAAVFSRKMPWIKQRYECCFLEDGAPKNVEFADRQEYRDSMHKMAFEFICRWDEAEDQIPGGPTRRMENYKIVICHMSFIQFCIAHCYKVSKEIIQLGAPVAHCSLTQLDVTAGDEMSASFVNRITHLPLTHRTSE